MLGESRDEAVSPPWAHCTSWLENRSRKSWISGALRNATANSPAIRVPSWSMGGKGNQS